MVISYIGKEIYRCFSGPVLACNLRCKMCYFSDEEERKKYRGILQLADIQQIAKGLFHRAIKLQIGCGAEPTLHKDLAAIIGLGKEYNIPYISLTTNGNLLTKEKLREAVVAGLNEITLSAHGFTRETYEYFMTNASFDAFCRLLSDIREVKKEFPGFKLHINYTVNRDNIKELTHVWETTGGAMDILQVRPVYEIGESEYRNFDLDYIYNNYDQFIQPVIDACVERNIICLAPGKEDLMKLGKSI
ncbi:MAG: radical SAM protein [Tannerellaceae bacterium]|nr:radical SAM protein [Tannerellaceae bacterium]MCD8263643.1 radical SAM protein [Tannerellaceae bacterium]